MTQEKGQGQVMVALGATMGSSEDSKPHTGKGRGAIKGGRKVVIWSDFSFFFSFFVVVFFLWPHLQHMEVPGPGFESELQLRPKPRPWSQWMEAPSTTYVAMPDP